MAPTAFAFKNAKYLQFSNELSDVEKAKDIAEAMNKSGQLSSYQLNMVGKGVGEGTEGVLGPKKVKYYRVQSDGESGSFKRLIVNEDGSISVLTKNSSLNLSAVTDEHAQYFLNEVRKGNGYIIEFEVDYWYHDMVMESAIPQYGYKKSVFNQGKTAPKIVDPTKPRPNASSISLEFPPIWNDFFEEVAHNAKILEK
ncbi:hypothetical protein PJ311_16175 [Bacillus sp. CLL-7-23]|uniref:Uncharacterized protein n=1 Tax=Bacillus changyiensis TaxID=3004103 RepID=A0ABT4X738_9BACI|nr:hypothetical protein [Bacillus changyiensis]MDA7028112.1 hypothetical protein [Bacillus changyiensis]